MKALGYVVLAIVVMLVVWAGFQARRAGEVTEGVQPTEAPPTVEPLPQVVSNPAPTAPSLKVHQVTFSASGFSVSQLSIKRGEVVTLSNRSGGEVRIPSNPHPIHTELPALDSGTLKDGQSYSFTFDKAGTFGVHNHFNPSQTTAITVTP